jgi:hypothetical protein
MIIPPPSRDDVATVAVLMVLTLLYVIAPFIGSASADAEIAVAVTVLMLFTLLVLEVAVVAWDVIKGWRVHSNVEKALDLVVLTSGVAVLLTTTPQLYTYLQVLINMR